MVYCKESLLCGKMFIVKCITYSPVLEVNEQIFFTLKIFFEHINFLFLKADPHHDA